MSGSSSSEPSSGADRGPGDVPPEVPDEFAAAYRAAYEAAMREADAAAPPTPPPAPEPRPEPAPRPERRVPPAPAPVAAPATAPVTGAQPADDEPTLAILTRRPESPDRPADEPPSGWVARLQASGYLAPALLVLLALALVLGAYGVGRVFAGHVDRSQSGGPDVMTSASGKQERQPTSEQKPAKGAWTQKVAAVRGIRATADCTSSAGVDAGGDEVTYGAAHLVDRTADTTWRCDGKAIGQVLTFDLGADVSVGEVGLIPGYAKTDSSDGTDRYAENNRVTQVRWKIGSRSITQTIDDSTKDRSVRLLRVPRTTARTVTLQILAVAPGPRDTTAISEVVIAEARG